MKKFRFLDWEVYNDSQELYSIIQKIVGQLPREYRFEIGSQVNRSALSIVLNIAEGSGKESDREMNRFFEIALGSLYETLAAADVLKRNKLVTEEVFQDILEKIDIISRQLGGFKKKLDK